MKSFSLLRLLLCAALLFTLFAPAARAATYYVATTGDDNNPGTQAQPLKTIGLAVSYAASGDTVLVADGTYAAPGNRNIDFGGYDIAVQSASGNPANCIIDCQQSGCAFILKSGETSKSLIAGFTIKNGTGYTVSGIIYGGGIYISNNSNVPTVNNCVFTGNLALNGGGGMYGGTATNCAFIGNSSKSNGGGMIGGTATNCTFTSNSSPYGGGMSGGTAINCTFVGNYARFSGSGMYQSAATNCTFTNNNSDDDGGGMDQGTATNCVFTGNSTQNASSGGGGMYTGTANNCVFTANLGQKIGGGAAFITAINCVFTANTSKAFGGGMYQGTAVNCIFTNNSAPGSSTASGNGGGMYQSTAVNCIFNSNSSTYYGGGASGGTATNCVFTNNSATFIGGGMYQGTATNCVFTGNSTPGSLTVPGNGGGTYAVSLYFCSVANNTATGNGGGVYLSNGTVTNCIVWGNTAGVSSPGLYDDGTSGTRAVTSSDVQGGHPVNGNLVSDPLFVNAAIGNLHLTSASPCIDKGATTVPTVPSGLAFPATDRDGANRTVGAKPDMGAYEYGSVGVFGTLTFDGISALAPAQNVTFQFRPTISGAAINATYFTTSDGAFYLYGVPNGSYNLWIKSPTYLSALVPVTVAGGVASITATLEPGDANNDNSCDSSDFGVLIGAFNSSASIPGSGYDSRADFNGDGSVDSSDFGLLIGNFNNVGAP